MFKLFDRKFSLLSLINKRSWNISRPQKQPRKVLLKIATLQILEKFQENALTLYLKRSCTFRVLPVFREFREKSLSYSFMGRINATNKEAAVRRFSSKSVFLKISPYSQEYICSSMWIFAICPPVLESLFSKVTGLQCSNFIKKRPQHALFSCKYCEISNNSFFYRTPEVVCGCFFRYVISLS